MHRTHHTPKAVSRGLLVALVLGFAPAALTRAQEARPAPAPTLIVPINATQRLQMSNKQAIKRGINRNEAVVRLAPAYGDPTTLLVTGLEPGIARVTLVDQNDREENFDIIVQLDVEYLKSILKRAAPTANVEPLPSANNTIVLRGTVDRAEDVELVNQIAQSVVGGNRVINGLRVGGAQQVQLCAVVAQVSRSDFRRLAFNFLLNGRNDYFLGSVVGAAVNVATVPAVAPFALGTPNGAQTNGFFGILNNGNNFFGFLQALKDENVTKLLAEPRVVTLSGKAASFVSGGEQAIPVPAGLGQIGIQFEEFGTRLNFLPLVLGNGKIHLEVEPEVSELNAAFGVNIQGTVVPGRTVQRVHTSVDLEPGQTLVIGGLIQRNYNASITKWPIIGELPYVGAAFSSKAANENESELVILVTPHLVDGMSTDQLPKLLPGMETRRPDDFELFLEGILEAPRGAREVRHGRGYVPAFKNGPTAAQFPCANGACGAAGACNGGACGGGETQPAALLAPAHALAIPTGTAPAAMPPVTPAALETPAPAPTEADRVPTPAALDRPQALPPLNVKPD